jgi:hypothetical protein
MMASLLKAKFPWVLCTIFSFVYFYLFSQVSTANPPLPFDKTGLIGGFCVWGNPAPDDKGCTKNTNSHMYSWYEDAVFTMIVVGAYFYGNKKDTIIYIALGGVVFFHGLLHFFLSTERHCLTSSDDPTILAYGWFLYLIFAFFLSVIISGIGFLVEYNCTGTLVKEKYRLRLVLLASSVVTFITYQLAHHAGTDWLLSALFATSHPIASVTGLCSKSPIFTNLLGFIFLAATLEGIVELMACQSFLIPLGGHIWYDLFLHTAVLLALPVFQTTTKQKTN